jgi:hypothetical protein
MYIVTGSMTRRSGYLKFQKFDNTVTLDDARDYFPLVSSNQISKQPETFEPNKLQSCSMHNKISVQNLVSKLLIYMAISPHIIEANVSSISQALIPRWRMHFDAIQRSFAFLPILGILNT